MIKNFLVPCMQKSHEAELSPKAVFRVFTKLEQCLGNAAEQNMDHHFFIAQNDVIEFMRKGKEVSVLHQMMSETTS
jgi:hypothetical protein